MKTTSEEIGQDPIVSQTEIGGERDGDDQEEKIGDGQVDDVAVGNVAIVVFTDGDDENDGIA